MIRNSCSSTASAFEYWNGALSRTGIAKHKTYSKAVEKTTKKKKEESKASQDNTVVVENQIAKTTVNPDSTTTNNIADDNTTTPPTIEEIATALYRKEYRNVIFFVGAGISVAAGIPDFRTPGTGLYDNLQKYALKSPQDLFDIRYFKSNPEPFFQFMLDCAKYHPVPTKCHQMMAFLDDKDVVKRIYTQNIDNLEWEAGINSTRVVNVHGSMHSEAHCISCKKAYSQREFSKFLGLFKRNDEIPVCTECHGIIKPDVTFFGESLPKKFFEAKQEDLCETNNSSRVDLIIVMGTSLQVQPAADLISKLEMAHPECPILLVNNTNSYPNADLWIKEDCESVSKKMLAQFAEEEKKDKAPPKLRKQKRNLKPAQEENLPIRTKEEGAEGCVTQ